MEAYLTGTAGMRQGAAADLRERLFGELQVRGEGGRETERQEKWYLCCSRVRETEGPRGVVATGSCRMGGCAEVNLPAHAADAGHAFWEHYRSCLCPR